MRRARSGRGRPGSQAGEETFLLRRDASKQEGCEQAGFQPAFVPEGVGEGQSLDGSFFCNGTQLRFDLPQDDGRRPIRREDGRRRHALTTQCAVDVIVQDLAMFAQEVRWLVEEVSQICGLFFKAGEIYGGHEFSDQYISEQLSELVVSGDTGYDW
mgnify:CR=1 FL=1